MFGHHLGEALCEVIVLCILCGKAVRDADEDNIAFDVAQDITESLETHALERHSSYGGSMFAQEPGEKDRDNAKVSGKGREIIIMTGIPGSGKKTQSKKIHESLKLPFFTKKYLMEAASESEAGKRLKVVSDDILMENLKRRISGGDCKDGFVLAGFPETLNQAMALDKILAQTGEQVTKVFNLRVQESEAPKILEAMEVMHGTKEEALRRFRKYRENTEPLLDFYRNAHTTTKVFEINAGKDIDAVAGDIAKVLERGEDIVDEMGIGLEDSIEFVDERGHAGLGGQINTITRVRAKWNGFFRRLHGGQKSGGGRKPTISDLRQGKFMSEHHSLKEYNNDLRALQQFENAGPLWSHVDARLELLKMTAALKKEQVKNLEKEQAESLSVDYLSAPQADNHVHHSAAMSQMHLLNFIQNVFRQTHHVHAIKEYLQQKGSSKTSLEALDKLVKRSKTKSLTLTMLDVYAHKDAFMRFDIFNQKYQPFKMKVFRDIFLKPATFINVSFPDGTSRPVNYMGDLTLDICSLLEETKYFPEWRISIYGTDKREYDKLSSFFSYKDVRDDKFWYGISDHRKRNTRYLQTIGAACQTNVKWIIQVPRIFFLDQFEGKTFGDYIENIFGPLLEDKDSIRGTILPLISGFDSVDDETKDPGRKLHDVPDNLTWTKVPQSLYPFSYYLYFMATGVAMVNIYQNTSLTFRPHCGEGGSTAHLLVCFMLADGIQHGTQLSNSRLMQYMYYIHSIPISMSPSSNNFLVRKYQDSPFGQFFNLGMFVSLSTDDPLMFYECFKEQNCLFREYEVMERIFDLSWIDLAEIGYNSIAMSELDVGMKTRLLATSKGSVPAARFEWRNQVWCQEWGYLKTLGVTTPLCSDYRNPSLDHMVEAIRTH